MRFVGIRLNSEIPKKKLFSHLIDDLVGILTRHDGDSLRWEARFRHHLFQDVHMDNAQLVCFAAVFQSNIFGGSWYLHAEWACRCILVVPSRHGARVSLVPVMFQAVLLSAAIAREWKEILLHHRPVIASNFHSLITNSPSKKLAANKNSRN